MIAIIQEHNRLNGVRFSVGEFTIVFVAAILIGFSYLVHGQIWATLLAAGIALNALWVIGFGVHAWRRGEMGLKLVLVLDLQHRRRLAREHPELGRHTLQMVAAALTPYAMSFLVFVEMLRGRR